jgi:hypothetical protein
MNPPEFRRLERKFLQNEKTNFLKDLPTMSSEKSVATCFQPVGIGERKWGGDFSRRMMMFESRVEIWGWKEQEEVERV